LQRLDHLRIVEPDGGAGLFARMVSLGVVSVWNSQYGKPLDGICTPHCVTLPLHPSSAWWRRPEFGPGRRGLVGVEAGFLEQFLVPVHDDGRTLERNAPGLAAGLVIMKAL
jgi:hypothetical protein